MKKNNSREKHANLSVRNWHISTESDDVLHSPTYALSNPIDFQRAGTFEPSQMNFTHHIIVIANHMIFLNVDLVLFSLGEKCNYNVYGKMLTL
jgi:hypothetical protein